MFLLLLEPICNRCLQYQIEIGDKKIRNLIYNHLKTVNLKEFSTALRRSTKKKKNQLVKQHFSSHKIVNLGKKLSLTP